jgi:hypothetical protein
MIEPLTIFNMFFIEGKIPSFNELVFARAIQSPQKLSWLLAKPTKGKKKKTGYAFNEYNKIKQDWTQKVSAAVKAQGFIPVKACYFHYLIIENTVKRDPSNIVSAAIKFCEDALMKCKVIENDGWKNVLGIRPYWILDRESTAGIFLVMASEPLCQNSIESYYNERKSNH